MCNEPHRKLLVRITTIAPIPVFPVFHVSGLDWIIQYVSHDPPPLVAIAYEMVITFMCPEFSLTTEEPIRFECSVPFERVHYGS